MNRTAALQAVTVGSSIHYSFLLFIFFTFKKKKSAQKEVMQIRDQPEEGPVLQGMCA